MHKRERGQPFYKRRFRRMMVKTQCRIRVAFDAFKESTRKSTGKKKRRRGKYLTKVCGKEKNNV